MIDLIQCQAMIKYGLGINQSHSFMDSVDASGTSKNPCDLIRSNDSGMLALMIELIKEAKGVEIQY